VTLGGVAAEAGRPPGKIKVWTSLSLTSDDPYFHTVVENLGSTIEGFARAAGKPVNLKRAHDVLLVIRSNNTAELWVDSAAVAVGARLKRDVKAGSIIFESDFADITDLRFPKVDIGKTDRVIYLFREGWRFGLFFDFNPDSNLQIEEVNRTLGTIYRRLRYRHLYDLISNAALFQQLVVAGWFPFVEILGGSDFNELIQFCEVGFPLDEAESRLLAKFDDLRLDGMLTRWIAKPHYASREAVLRSAVAAYKAKDPVAVLKIVLTEIEGVLSEAYHAESGSRAKLRQLLEFAKKAAEHKAGGPDTLFFPTAFAEYLDAYTFAKFDPGAPASGSAGSRHAVGHGAASAESYTQTRALQAILTLDQLAFYT
jgi:hypothetical protein